MELNTDWKELFESFQKNNVDFLLVGAMAMAYHGLPRLTGDIDIWIRRSPENAERIIRALEIFGVGSLSFKIEDIVKPEQVIQIGYPPRRVDILNFLTGLDFEQAWEKRVIFKVGELNIPMISLADLIINKRETGRPKDISDLIELENRSDP